MNVTEQNDYTPEEKAAIRVRTKKSILAIGIVSIIMMFAGITSAYIVRQGEGNWTRYDLPMTFYISTVLIVAASITIYLSLRNIRKGDRKGALTMLWITLGLSIGFCISQFMGWSQLVDQGIYLVGNPSGSFMYVLTGLHLAHLAGGLIYLGYVLFQLSSPTPHPDDELRISLCGTYWHFLDLLWIYLFLFLVFIR